MIEKIYFESGRVKLCGVLFSVDKDRPIIILCHGFSSSKDSSTYVKLEETLNKEKISTFRFDFYGHGESEGKFEDITITKAVEGILSAYKLLKERGYNKIGLAGSSFGGMASLIAATKLEELYVLALKCPVSNYLAKLIAQKSKAEMNSWKEEGFIHYISGIHGKTRLNYSFFEDATKYNDYSEYYKTIDIPTLIIHGDKDETVPIEQSKKTCSVIPNCKLEVIEGASHSFKEKNYFEIVINLITNFIVKYS